MIEAISIDLIESTARDERYDSKHWYCRTREDPLTPHHVLLKITQSSKMDNCCSLTRDPIILVAVTSAMPVALVVVPLVVARVSVVIYVLLVLAHLSVVQEPLLLSPPSQQLPPPQLPPLVQP